MATRTRKQDTKKNSRSRKVVSRITLGSHLKKISKVQLEGFKVGLVYEDGMKGNVSLEHLFLKPQGLAAEILKGSMFEKCFIESGALAWPNGFELCPDALRDWMK
ncbi:MAG: DUF2442 domain-containing protein [Deltaproteobacteria bacterium]|nr:DUF2442 domain-containing protein [Deltaproteobacteria bacterium]